MRLMITLECMACRSRNYTMMKNKAKHPEKMKTHKFCKTCREHTEHRETK